MLAPVLLDDVDQRPEGCLDDNVHGFICFRAVELGFAAVEARAAWCRLRPIAARGWRLC